MNDNGSQSDGPPSPSAVAEEAAPKADRPAFKDRRTGLIVFGTLELLIAVAILGMSGLNFAMSFKALEFVPPGGPPTSRVALLSAGFLYLALALGAAILGVGSIRCRRWARALNLVLAWIGLVLGAASLLALLLVWPSLTEAIAGPAAQPQPGFAFILGCMAFGLVFVYLVLPAAFVLFYRSRNVKATCEFYDPKERWTDRVPLPVLAGSILLLSAGAAVLTPAMGFGFPLFGWIVTGAASWVVVILLALGSLACAWGLARLERWGWLGALGLSAFNGLNALVSFGGSGLIETYERMQMPPEQIEIMRQMGMTRWLTPMMAISIVLMLVYYLWLGRYFRTEDSPTQ